MGVAGQKPAAVGLFAVDGDPMPGQRGRFSAGARGHGQGVPAQRVGDNARNHISFGKGIHFCLGSAMARMEARVVLDVLARKMPDMRLVQDQSFRVHPNIQFRGPEELWLTW